MTATLFKAQVGAELQSALDRDTPELDRALSGMVAAQAAILMAREGKGTDAVERSFLRFAAILGLLAFTSDMRGRRRLLLEARAAGMDDDKVEPAPRAGIPKDLRPPRDADLLRRAAEELLLREPKLALKASAVAKVYSEQGFAAARAARIEVTKAVQRSITRMVKRGEREITARMVLADLTGWTEGYAGLVYRTNVSTAYTAGRFSQARDPEIRRVAGAFELVVVDDAVTRRGRVPEDRGENHLAAQGLVASFEDDIWTFAAPPNGYNCREAIRLVSFSELSRMGLLDEKGRIRRRTPATFSSFVPHPRFRGGRPDQRIYGSFVP